MKKRTWTFNIKRNVLKKVYRIENSDIKRYARRSRHQRSMTKWIFNFESRVDRIIYRIGWAETIGAARELLRQKLIKVNKIVVTNPQTNIQVGSLLTCNNYFYKWQGVASEDLYYLSRDERAVKRLSRKRIKKNNIDQILRDSYNDLVLHPKCVNC